MTSCVISENGSFFSVHSDPTVAETYLDDLKKRWPHSEWELETSEGGRHKGHEKLVWAGTGSWDFVNREVINFNRAWIFEGEITENAPNLRVGALVNRFYTLKFKDASIEPFTKRAKILMDWWQASEEPDNFARITAEKL